MASQQVAALFLVYLTLSGHAFRHDASQVASALQAKASTPMEPEEAEEAFYQKVANFMAKPSMKLAGSGGSLLRFYFGLSQANKQWVTECLQDDGADMVESLVDPTSLEVDEEGDFNSVAFLNAALTQWFRNQQDKYPEGHRKHKEEYNHCTFHLEAAEGDIQQNITREAVAKMAPLVLQSNTPGQKCLLASTFGKTVMESKWAAWFIASEGNSSDVPQDSLLEQKLMSLVDLSTQGSLDEGAVQEAGFVEWIIGGIIFFLLVRFISREPSSEEKARDREWGEIRMRGAQIARTHNANRGRGHHGGQFMTRRGGRRAAVNQRNA